MSSIDGIKPTPVTMTFWLVIETIGDSQSFRLHLKRDDAEWYVRSAIDDYFVENMPSNIDTHREIASLLSDPSRLRELLDRFYRFTKGRRKYHIEQLTCELA